MIAQPAVAAAHDYPASDLTDVGARLRFHRNEAALPAPEHVVAAIRALDGNALARYPVDLFEEFRTLLADRMGTGAQCLAIGSGADEILGALMRAFLQPGDSIIAVTPTFGMYAHTAAIAGATLNSVPYRERWRLDPRRLIESSDARTRIVVLGHPNNPTGDALAREDLDTIARGLPQTVIVVDEVYLCLGSDSLVDCAARYPNVVVVGSFSKAAALAGLRVGYAVASAQNSAVLRRVISPFPVGVASLTGAMAYLHEAEATAAFQSTLNRQIERSLSAIAQAITPFCLNVWRGPANYLLADFGGAVKTAAHALADADIAVRSFSDPSIANCLRFCAAADAPTAELIATLRTAFAVETSVLHA
ncbi:MAG: histidinol-phosphate aminotransferase family protein [Candidatus Eremiobacteraeota bacterium]|nr:histidinol-phosphate aminotransferase family protein [Candidatus Eremiobacteraeota bacterium]